MPNGPKESRPPTPTQKPEGPKPSVASKQSNKYSCEGPTMDPLSANLLVSLQHFRHRPSLVRRTRIANISSMSTAVQHRLPSHARAHVTSHTHGSKNINIEGESTHTHVPVCQKIFSTYSQSLTVLVLSSFTSSSLPPAMDNAEPPHPLY